MFKKLAGLFAVLTAGLFWSVQAMAAGQIDGSAHDFVDGATGWDTSGEICVVCHAPHNNTQPSGLLWNRTLTSPSSYASAFHNIESVTMSPMFDSSL